MCHILVPQSLRNQTVTRGQRLGVVARLAIERVPAAAAGAPARARWLAEKMVLLLQASLLVQYAPSAVSEAFIATRLRQWEGTYGVVDLAAQDVAAILERARVGS